MKKDRLLLVDVSNLLYKAIHTNSHLKYNGKFTGGIFGFLSQLCKSIREVRANKVILCLDSFPYLRSQLVDYKTDRKTDTLIIKRKIRSTKYILRFANFFGINHWKYKGMESDDLIANICINNSGKHEIIILSDDSDLFQLLHLPDVVIRRKGDYFTHEHFKEKFPKVNLPDEWAWIHVLSGGHNGLPGLPGIGEKKAMKMVQENKIPESEELKLHFKVAKLPYSTLHNNEIFQHKSHPTIQKAKSFLMRRYGIEMSFGMECALRFLKGEIV